MIRVARWLPLVLLLSAQAAPPDIRDEAQVPPYTLPDPLLCLDGSRVDSAEKWRSVRRPELLRLFEQQVYGKTLVARPPDLRFVVREERSVRGGAAVRLRVAILFEGREDGRQMEMLLVLPTQPAGRVPVFLGLNFDGNYTTTGEPDLPLPSHWVNGLYLNKPKDHQAGEAGRGIHQYMWPTGYILERGYGLATIGYGEVEPDEPGRWKHGPRGLGPEPGEHDWGSVGAWAWAYSRAMDYLETHPRVDAGRVAICGFSRLGKAAMWAGAQDERFALVVSNNSGAGGLALSKRIFGETIGHMAARLGHWFAPAYLKYAEREADLPVDQHLLAALIAPRPLLATSATLDLWSDPKGEFLALRGADPVYRLLGTDGLAVADWPAPSVRVESRLGYFLRPGPHDVTLEDWQAMLSFADRHLRPAR